MSFNDINYTGKRLLDKEFKIKFKTGEDIYKAADNAVAGEMLLESPEKQYSIKLTKESDPPSITFSDLDPLSSSSPWSLSFWIKILDEAGGAADFRYFEGSNWFRIYKAIGANYINLVQGSTVLSASNSTANSFDLGSWTHIAVTNTPTSSGTTGTRKLYINGTQNHGGTLTADNDLDFNYNGSIYGNPSGARVPNQSFLNDVAIFKSKTLSDSEILSIYNQGAYGNLSQYNPDHWFKLNGDGSNYGSRTENLIFVGTYSFSNDITDVYSKNPALYFATQMISKGNSSIYKASDLLEENKLPFSRSYLKTNTGAHANTSTNTGESFTCTPGARTGNMTFSIWMRAYRTDSDWNYPVSTYSSSETNIIANSKSSILWYVNPDKAGGSINQLMGHNADPGSYLGPPTPIDNVEPLIWHHYAVTREVGAGTTAGYDKMKVYLNGVHQSAHDWEVITDGIVFGRDNNDDGVITDDYLYFGSDLGFYAGPWDFDQAAIFDETLNDSQITEIYNNGRAGNIRSIGQGPTNWWRIEKAVGGQILDEGSDGTRHITFNNPDHSVIAEHASYSSFNSLKFNGTSSDKLLIEDFKLSGAFSISVWVKTPQGFSASANVFPLGNAHPDPHDANAVEFFFDIGNGRLRFYVYDTVNGGSLGFQQQVNGTHFGDNYWSNFIVTYDGGQSAAGITAYQLGVNQEIENSWLPILNSSSTFQEFSISNNPLAIGSRPTSAYNQYQEGLLNNYVIWNKELSPEEVVEVYNGGQPLDFSVVEDRIKPKHWWKLENDVKDYIGGKDGNLTGGEFVAVAPHYVGINPY